VVLGDGVGRTLRGTVAGAACLTLSLCLHVLAGGAVPGLGALLLMTCVAAGVCTWWADRRRGPGALVALSLGVQVVLHAMFALLAGHLDVALGLDPAMGAAHVAAAVAMAWILARGEDALWELCGALAHVWAPAPSAQPAPLVQSAVPLRAPRRHLPLRGALLARARPLRGPPVVSAL
jgi:hypothetical protein